MKNTVLFLKKALIENERFDTFDNRALSTWYRQGIFSLRFSCLAAAQTS